MVWQRRAVSLQHSAEGTYPRSQLRIRNIGGSPVHHGGLDHVLKVKSVVLAAGGFEGNARMRAQYPGPCWDTALVCGTRQADKPRYSLTHFTFYYHLQ